MDRQAPTATSEIARPQGRIERWAWCLVLVPFIVLAVLVPLTPNTPYGDDFDYSATAWHLVDTGVVRMSDWPTTMLVSHATWGALFCKLGGNSYLMLRISMFVLSAAAAVTLVAWSRREGHSTSFALWCGITFALNPLVVSLEYTFLTDITGASLGAILLYAGRRLPHVERWRSLSGFSLLGGLAWLARQTAAIPFVFAVAVTGWDALRGRSNWTRLGLLLAPFLICMLGFRAWLNWSHGVPENHNFSFLNINTLSHHAERMLTVLFGLGLQLAPLSAMLVLAGGTSPRAWPWKSFTVAVLGLAIVAAISPAWPSLLHGEIFNVGLHTHEVPPGETPTSLQGPTCLIAGREMPLFTVVFLPVSGLSTVILLTAVLHSARRLMSFVRDPWSLLATLSLLANFVLLQFTWVYVDRYLVALVPLAIMVFAERMPSGFTSRRGVVSAGWIATLSVGLFSIVGIQDGMQRTDAFWTVARALDSLGIDPQHVDAGLAYGGVYRYSPNYRGPKHVGPYLRDLPASRREVMLGLYGPLTVIDNRQLAISFGETSGYEIVARHTFRSWFRSGEVLVLLRNDVQRDALPRPFQQWLQSSSL